MGEATPPEKWGASSLLNQNMLEHLLLARLVGETAATAAQGKSAPFAPSGSIVLSEAVVDSLSSEQVALPSDLGRELRRERHGILEALHTWVADGGTHHRLVPRSMPWNGTQEALRWYVAAKRRQTQLDLLTVAFLH